MSLVRNQQHHTSAYKIRLSAADAADLRSKLPEPNIAVSVAIRAKALADRTRILLLVALRSRAGEVCVNDLVAVVADTEQSVVSHHLRVLLAAELVSKRHEGQRAYYSITSAGEALVAAHLEAGQA